VIAWNGVWGTLDSAGCNACRGWSHWSAGCRFEGGPAWRGGAAAVAGFCRVCGRVLKSADLINRYIQATHIFMTSQLMKHSCLIKHSQNRFFSNLQTQTSRTPSLQCHLNHKIYMLLIHQPRPYHLPTRSTERPTADGTAAGAAAQAQQLLP